MPLNATPRAAAVVALLLSLSAACSAADLVQPPPVTSAPQVASQVASPSPDGWSTVSWPALGQASYALDGQQLSSPDQRPVPIASVAKVMTAYLTVHHLTRSARLVVDSDDVADTQRRAGHGESVVTVVRGEVLDRHEALEALLVPSANNVAVMLAARVSGSRSAFVRLMNQTADRLGMHDTTYTDPSGYQDSTVSTAHDQLLLLRAALRSPELAAVMGSPSAVLPVVGRVRNTNTLLGRDGFVAGKTGSTSAAGGCLVFRVVRGGRVLDGVVLGQRGGRLVDAALLGASQLARAAFAA